MKIEIEQTTITGPSAVRLTHGDESMVWDVSVYSKSSDHKSPMNPQLIFREINGWWASQPLTVQNQFWELYQEAREALDTIFQVRDLQERLQDIVRRIYAIDALSSMDHWVRHRSEVRFPSDLKETIEEIRADGMDYPNRKEKTYLKGEYIDLATMTVKLRVMVPIWAEFIKMTRREVGGNSKELEAFRLLYHADIHRSAAMARLQEYVQVTVRTLVGSDLPATVILNGMSENELADWMLATCVVRRLAMCQISVSDDSSNIITNVYQYVRLGVQGAQKKHGKKFGGRVNLRPPSERGEEKQKRSVAEINKVKQELPDGIRVFLNVYMDDPQRLLYRALLLTRKGSTRLVAPKPDGVDERLLECMLAIDKIPEMTLEPFQITLIQYTLAHVLSAKGIPLLTFESMKVAIGVAQCVLWEWGFYDLAALLTAQRYEIGEEAMIGAPETRARIPKEMLEEQAVRWPYQKPVRGKVAARQSNIAAKAVDILSDMMVEADWELFCPPRLVALVAHTAVGRRMTVPSDIRLSLSLLVNKMYDTQKESGE